MDSIQARPVVSPAAFPAVREAVLLNPSFAGRSLRELRLREGQGVTIVAVTRSSGEILLDPPADTRLQLSDKLCVLGMPGELDAFLAQISAGKG